MEQKYFGSSVMLRIVFVVLLFSSQWGLGQFTIASDNAGNYAGNWNSNQGSGFDNWSYIATGGLNGSAGRFIGNPSSAGISGMNSSSFALFANPNVSDNESKAFRSFSGGALQFGDTFSFQMGMNFDANNENGFKGIDLRSSSGVVLNFNMGSSSTITWGRPGAGEGGNLFMTYGTQAMNFQITKVGVNQYRIEATPRTGSTNFDETHTLAGEISAFEFYAGRLDSGDQRQPYYNNLSITNSGVFAIASGTETYSRSLTGTGNLIKSGDGSLILTGTNTYTGTTTVSGGTLQLNAASGNTLGNSSVTVNGGTLQISTNQTLANLTLTNGGLTIDSGTTLTLSGNVTIPEGFTISNSGTLVIEGTLTDNRATKSFGGTVRYAASSGSQTIVGGNYTNLELSGGSTKSFDASTQISGNFTVSGGTVTPPSTVTFNGASVQSIAGLAYNNIEFSNGETNAKIFTSNASVSPTSAITFSGSPGTVDFDGVSNTFEFVLQSTSAGTARIGDATGWTLSGQVRAERFVPDRRAWRLLTAPLKGTSNTSIFTNWQGQTGEGLLLWGPNPSEGSGLVNGPQANIWSYGNGWTAVSNTNNTQLFDGSTNNAFLVFAVGPHGGTNIAGNTAAVATTLKPKGELITGTVTTASLAQNQFHLLANPYASPINTETLISATSNSGFKLWLLDPTPGLGAYVTYDGSNWSIPTPTNDDKYIQSGQGFFVSSATASTFTFNEAHKVVGNSNTWFAKATTQNTNENKIRVLLDRNNNNQWQLVDGILSVSGNNYSNEVDAKDALKVSNFNENIQFRNGSNNLAIEYQNLPTATTEQPIRLTGTTATSYRLRVRTEGFVSAEVQPILQDTQSGTNHLIPTDGSTLEVNFTGATATASNPDNRFKIVYQQVLGIEQPIASTIRVYPNPVTEGQFSIVLPNSNEGASYEITNYLGQVVQKGNLSAGNNSVSVPNQAEGVYLLRVQQNGEVYTTKIVKK